jgi:hypothetical protein
VATTNRDFRVKHGIAVAEGGTFGGTVSVATPTENGHATTKQYVDNLVGTVVVASGSTFPASPTNGQLFYDTATDHLYIYYSSTWTSIAMYNDGTGLVVSIFKDAGYYDEAGDYTDSGYYNTVAWEATWDGGISVDNFN